MTNHLELEWQQYRDGCYPDGTSKPQEVEVRRAFYAGAVAVVAIREDPAFKWEEVLQELPAVIRQELLQVRSAN